jgi:hypothetical protein
LLASWEREDAVMSQLLVDDLTGDYLRACCRRYKLDWRERHVAVTYDIEDGRWAALARVLGLASDHPREAVRAWLAARDPGCAIDSPAWRRLTATTAAQRAATIQHQEHGRPVGDVGPSVPLTPQQAAVLWVLHEEHPVTMTVEELAGHLRPGEQSIRGYLRSLRELGLVATASAKGGSVLTSAGLAAAASLPNIPAVLELLRTR